MVKEKTSPFYLLFIMFLTLFGATSQASAELDIDEIMNAAQQGDTEAQQDLGLMYAKGQGVKKNDIKAYVWSSLAAAQGEESAAKHRDVLAERFTPDQLRQAQTLAAELQASIHKPKRLPSSLYAVASSSPQPTNQEKLRAWVESIKPAAGGK